MIGTVLLWMFAGGFFAVAVFLWLNRLAQFRERTIYDVPELLRHIDEAALQNLFDMEAEAAERREWGRDFFRRKQRYRLEQGKRFCRLAVMIIVKIRVISLLLYFDRFSLLRTPSVAALRRLGRARPAGTVPHCKEGRRRFCLGLWRGPEPVA